MYTYWRFKAEEGDRGQKYSGLRNAIEALEA